MYNIRTEKPSEDVKSILAKDCYVSLERSNCAHFWRKQALKSIEMQNFDVAVLETLDNNYYLACKYVNLIYKNDKTIFIGLYEDDLLKAHTVLGFYDDNVYVANIVVPDNKYFVAEKDSEGLTPAYLMYNIILDYIDKLINDKYGYIYFMANKVDMNSEIALLGHEYIASEEPLSAQRCYIKQVVKNNARNFVS